MANITTGLTKDGSGREGFTPHYSFSYDSALQKTATNPTGVEPARTNALIAVCEADYNLMAGWFGNIKLSPLINVPIPVQVANLSGGAGTGGTFPKIGITLKGGASGVALLRYLMVSEVTELFMESQHQGWADPDDSNEGSAGEGLSRFLAQQFLVLEGLGTNEPGYAISPSWLNSSLPTTNPASTQVVGGFNYGSRTDYVNKIIETDHGIDPATGCAMLFLYYLHTQLGFSINQIIGAASLANASSILAHVFQKLTGKNEDPFPNFRNLLGAYFPAGNVSSIAGPNPDDPFPLNLWIPWFLIHPDIKMQPGATITSLWRDNGVHLDLFVTGTDGAVWSTWWEGAPGWQPWFLIHPEIKMQPGATVTALWRGTTHLDLFVTGTDGAVWSTWWESKPGWQAWFLIHPEIKFHPGSTVTALWRDSIHLDLFVTGTDGAVWSTWYEGTPGWQRWFLIHPEIKMQPGATVTALWRGATHLDLFVTGTDGAVWSTWWESKPAWQPWALIRPEVKFHPGGTVTALWRDSIHLDLFVTGTDGAVWSTWYEGAPGWQGWFLIHPEIKMQPGAPVTALWRGNHTHLDLFVTGTDGAVWSTWYEGAPGWQGWFLIHPEIKFHPGGTVSALWRGNNMHLDLFVTGTDGAVWSTWWNALV